MKQMPRKTSFIGVIIAIRTQRSRFRFLSFHSYDYGVIDRFKFCLDQFCTKKDVARGCNICFVFKSFQRFLKYLCYIYKILCYKYVC